MEIITMESSAYKELMEKIEKIAGYVRENEREQAKRKIRQTCGWITGKSCHFWVSAAGHCNGYGEADGSAMPSSGGVPLPVFGSGTADKRKRVQLQSPNAGRV